MVDVKYGICLYSKHTGEHCYLGSQFESVEELESYANENVCLRCNRYEVVYIPKGHLWVNRKDGFQKCF